MKDTKITNENPLPDKVEVNLNMFGALMLNRIGGHVDGADVVTIHQCGLAEGGGRATPAGVDAARKPRRHH